jgi:hypothetical protein
MFAPSDTITWLFDGVGGAALIALLGLMWKRFKPKDRANESVLTAQAAKVDRSPVASGKDITQNISETHHHHYPGPILPPPVPSQAPTAQPKYAAPHPNVQYVLAETAFLWEQIGGGLFEQEGKPNAILIRFSNEARLDGPNLTARLKAVLIYRYGQSEVDVAGSWLHEASDICEFGPDSRRHKLIAGVVEDGQFGAITGRAFIAHRRNWYMSDRLDLKGFKEGTLLVQLIDVTRGNDLLYKGEFSIRANPISISAI